MKGSVHSLLIKSVAQQTLPHKAHAIHGNPQHKTPGARGEPQCPQLCPAGPPAPDETPQHWNSRQQKAAVSACRHVPAGQEATSATQRVKRHWAPWGSRPHVIYGQLLTQGLLRVDGAKPISPSESTVGQARRQRAEEMKVGVRGRVSPDACTV